MLPKEVNILGTMFDVIIMPLTVATEENSFSCEQFNLIEKRISVNSAIDKEAQMYGLFHAIEEILLTYLGQYYNHQGFQGFSYVMFRVLLENNLINMTAGGPSERTDTETEGNGAEDIH